MNTPRLKVWSLVSTLMLGACLLTALAGCGSETPATSEQDTATASSKTHAHENPDETCFICDPAKRDKGRLWCKEHGRYEDRCWLCHPELEDEDRLYCTEHFLYEDECHLCHPELKSTGTDQAAQAESTDVKRCSAHNVAQSVCFICDPALRDEGRLWCKEHSRYEDRCWLCHPELEDKDRAYCTEHYLYEDECFICNPALQADKAPQAKPASTTAKKSGGLFCNEHGVPEIECGICQPDLAANLKPGQMMKIRFASKQSTAKAGIGTAQPIRSDVAPGVRAYCEINYNANDQARLTPQAPGVVSRIAVDVGAKVEAGQVLAELDSPALARAKSAYLDNIQALELARIDLDRSEVIHKNTQKALALSEGELSLGELELLSKLDMGLNRRDLLSSHADLVAAKSAYERERKLRDQNISSEADYQAAEAAYRKAWAEHLAVRDELAFNSKRDLEAKTRAHRAAKFALDSARRQLLTLGLSRSQIEQVPEQTDAELARLYLRAPFDGTIIERIASVGESIEPGQAVLSMADLSSMWLALSIPADQASLVKPGMRVEAELPDLPGGAVDGKLSWVDSSVNAQSRMVKARAVIPNPQGELKAGMFGEARIIIAETAQSVRVPRAALQEYENQPYVFVKLEDDLYGLRRVAIGARADGAVDVLAGLGPDDAVVTTGSFVMLSEFLKSRLGAGCVDE